ncbi:hypothetical protein ACOMHN_035245 [Nucella lapillus]
MVKGVLQWPPVALLTGAVTLLTGAATLLTGAVTLLTGAVTLLTGAVTLLAKLTRELVLVLVHTSLQTSGVGTHLTGYWYTPHRVLVHTSQGIGTHLTGYWYTPHSRLLVLVHTSQQTSLRKLSTTTVKVGLDHVIMMSTTP